MKKVVLKVNGTQIMPIMSAKTMIVTQDNSERYLNDIIDELTSEVNSLKQKISSSKETEGYNPSGTTNSMDWAE